MFSFCQARDKKTLFRKKNSALNSLYNLTSNQLLLLVYEFLIIITTFMILILRMSQYI